MRKEELRRAEAMSELCDVLGQLVNKLCEDCDPTIRPLIYEIVEILGHEDASGQESEEFFAIPEALASLDDYHALHNFVLAWVRQCERDNPKTAYDLLWYESFECMTLGFWSVKTQDVLKVAHCATMAYLIDECARIAAQYDLKQSYHEDAAMQRQAFAAMLKECGKSAWISGVRAGEFIPKNFHLTGGIRPQDNCESLELSSHWDKATVVGILENFVRDNPSERGDQLWKHVRAKLREASCLREAGSIDAHAYSEALDSMGELLTHLPDCAHRKIVSDMLRANRAIIHADFEAAVDTAQRAWAAADAAGLWGLRSLAAQFAAYGYWKTARVNEAVIILLDTLAATVFSPHTQVLSRIVETFAHRCDVRALIDHSASVPDGHFKQRLCALACGVLWGQREHAEKLWQYWHDAACSLPDPESRASLHDAHTFYEWRF